MITKLKKNAKLYEELTQEFFVNAKEKGLSKNLTAYVWNILIAPQKTYSFCSAHGLAYSIVGLQEMNLACMYPTIFWNTANLIVDSGGAEAMMVIEEDEDDDDDDDKKKKGDAAIQFGKTAAAIGKFQKRGIKILPPDINNSSFTFTPNAKDNTITYGLRGITNVSTKLIDSIIENRPYTSIDDFTSRVKATRVQMLNLIKSGAFDSLSAQPRENILYDFIKTKSDLKKRITMQNMSALIEYGLIPEEYDDEVELYHFNKFLKQNKTDTHFILSDKAIEFFISKFDADLITDGELLEQKVWAKVYKKSIDKLQNFIKDNGDMLLDKLNNYILSQDIKESADGDISHWEMESVSFYNHAHELEKCTKNFIDFNCLPSEPVVARVNRYKDKEFYKYETVEIAGTVIDKDKDHSTVTLLTKTGVVIAKIFKDLFAEYDKQISKKEPDGSKKIIERSWFKKGTLLILHGFRRGTDFVVRAGVDKNAILIKKITKINDDGSLTLKTIREEEV